jgi:CheY-like chemotaxis protein
MGRILVVEDDPISRELVTHALVEAGHDVHTATDGLQAGEMVEQVRFDAIITDEMMPTMSGLDLCRHVRNLGQQMPIVLVTSMDEDDFRPELRDEYGIVGVLGKPLVPPLLLFILDAQLQASQAPG